jgi:hypothetical protein
MVTDYTEVKTDLVTDKSLNTLPPAAGILPVRASRQPFGTICATSDRETGHGITIKFLRQMMLLFLLQANIKHCIKARE